MGRYVFATVAYPCMTQPWLVVRATGWCMALQPHTSSAGLSCTHSTAQRNNALLAALACWSGLLWRVKFTLGRPWEKAACMCCCLTLIFGTILDGAVQRCNNLCQPPLAQPGHVTPQWKGFNPSLHSMLKLYSRALAFPKRSLMLAVLVCGEVHGAWWP